MTFVPKYSFKYRIGGLLITIVGGASLLLGLSNGDMSLKGIGVFFLGLGIFGTLTMTRKVIFGEVDIIFTRFLLSPVVFSYSDIEDIGNTQIKIGRKFVSVLSMENGAELISLFRKMVREKKIQPSQIAGKLVAEEALLQQVIKFSIIPTVIGGLILTLLLDRYLNFQLDFRISLLISFIIISCIIYFVLKRQRENI